MLSTDSSVGVTNPDVVSLSLLPQGAVEGELDPEDDPNNQGEDEFEEAEDERPQHRVAGEEEDGVEEGEEPAAPAQHVDTHPGREQPAVEEELVVSMRPGKNERAVRGERQVKQSSVNKTKCRDYSGRKKWRKMIEVAVERCEQGRGRRKHTTCN